MKHITENIDKVFFKDFVWYEDVVYNEGYNNLYFINPHFGQCILMLSRHGELYWGGELFEDTFSRYFGLSLSDFRTIVRQYVYGRIEDGRPIEVMKKRKVISYPEGVFF
jgi:hypothetical protein